MTKIEWTERTWNPVVGCSVVSPGCTHCYAMAMAARIEAMNFGRHIPHAGSPARVPQTAYAGTTQPSKAGPVWTGKVAFAGDDKLTEPLRRRKPTTYFVNSMGDLFHESVPDEWIDRVFRVIKMTPQHTYQILTKRSRRMRDYMADPERAIQVAFEGRGEWPPRNAWLGVSAEDQERADNRRNDFAETPAAVKFVSYEPMLGPINWAGWHFVNQIICGDESGPRRRPARIEWHRTTRDYCAEHGIAFFDKQRVIDGRLVKLPPLDGVTHDAMPEARR